MHLAYKRIGEVTSCVTMYVKDIGTKKARLYTLALLSNLLLLHLSRGKYVYSRSCTAVNRNVDM